MRALSAAPTLLSAALAILVAGTAPASAATTEIGAVGEIRSDTPPDPMTSAAGAGTYTVQVRESTGTYAVPPGFGVITAWSHRTGGGPGSLTFKVYRPTGAPGRFLVLAANERAVRANTTHDFPVRIAVRPGDRIGISTTTVQVAYRSFLPADQLAFFRFREPDPPPGSIATQDGPSFVGYRADVAARVETDGDGDGFGDDSQDPCPTLRGPGGRPCPVPPAFRGCPTLAANVIRGSRAANRITGTPRGDRIFAASGKDRVDGLSGDDCIDLGSGADRGRGGSGADLVRGSRGSDRISGNAGNDRLRGGSSGDRLLGSSGNDVLHGESGNDRVAGGGGRDRISGGSGRDRISARGGGRDRVSCGRGTDTVTADSRDRVGRDCERVRR